VHVELRRQALDGSKGQVPLATFHGTHEGAMPPDVFAERLLREAHLLTEAPEVLSDDELQHAFHGFKHRFLTGSRRQTDEWHLGSLAHGP